MCGSLRLEEQAGVARTLVPGGSALVDFNGARINLSWYGDHARSETLQKKFLSRGWKVGYVKALSFTERNTASKKYNELVEFKSPAGKRIKVIGDFQNKVFRIVTRPAQTVTESQVHHRFPVTE